MAKRKNPPHCIQRGGKWHALLIVPRDLHDKIGKRKFSRSLETSDRAIAARRAPPIVATWKATIENARAELSGVSDLEREALFWRGLRTEAEANGEPTDAFDWTIEGWLERHFSERVLKADLDKHDVDAGDPIREQQAEAIRLYKIATGELVRTLDHIDEWAAAWTGKDKSRAQMRADIEQMAYRLPYLRDVTAAEVQRWASELVQKDDLTPKTVTRKLSACRTYWRYLRQQGIVERGREPFAGVELPTRRKEARRLAFKAEDVATLLEAAKAKGDTSLVAVIEIAMWTGMRIAEVCALATDDVDLEAPIPFLRVTDAKTPAGTREVPIHPKLKRTLRRLVKEASDGYVVPNLTEGSFNSRSDAVGKRFGRLKKAQGYGPAHVFHSIRKTVTTQLENAGVSENLAADVVGHEKPRITYGLYSGGASLATKQAAIRQLAYP